MSEKRLSTLREPHSLIKMFRKRPRPGNRDKLTQEALASLIARDPRTIREWESGMRLPSSESLMQLISVFVEQRIFIEGKEREEAGLLWEAVSDSFVKLKRFAEYPPFDEHWFEALLKDREKNVVSPLQVSTERFSLLAQPTDQTGSIDDLTQAAYDQDAAIHPSHVDWGEAMDVSRFYGREQELTGLEYWIVEQRCRLVALLGMGGIGKSALAIRCAQQVQSHFDVVLWRSLRNAPSLEEFLTDCLPVLVRQHTNIPEGVEKKIALLLSSLRTSRCLLVLDNVEAILRGHTRARAGLYREGYDDYGALLQLIGETSHQSCVLLTSREKPRGFAALEGEHAPVRSLMLAGLREETCLTLLREKALFGPDDAWKALISRYAGNPLALKFVSCTLQEIFGGNIQAFLAHRKTVFGDIRDLLDEQFERLSAIEKGLLYWLAIEREMTSLDTLLVDMAFLGSRDRSWEAFDALVRHSSWVERVGAEAVFTLQPVVIEYVTDRLIDQMCEEIEAESNTILTSHALMKAQAREYVRKSQERLILKPVAEKLLTTLGKPRVESKLRSILKTTREQSPRIAEYMGANVLHLLIQMRCDLRGWDFSALTIRQAYLRGADLRDVSFAHCHFARTLFTEAFGNICCVAFSPDGQFLVAGTTGGEVRWWNTITGEHVRIYVGHTSWVLSIAFSLDGALLASTGSDQAIKVWDVQSGQCLSTLLGHTTWVMSVAFSPDSALLASSSADRTIRLWERQSGKCLHIFHGHAKMIRSVAFSPNGSLLASGVDERIIKLWDVSTGECLKVIQEQTTRIRALSFSPNGSLLASGGDDQKIRLWDVSVGVCINTFVGHTNDIRAVAFSPDGCLLISGSDDQTVKLWDVSTGKCLRTLYGHSSSVWSVAFSPESSQFASGAFDRTIKLWSIADGQCLRTLQGYVDYVWSVAFASTGSLLASGGESQMVKLWDIQTGQCLRMLQGHSDLIRTVAFSPDGTVLASGGDDQTVRLWDVSTGECLHVLYGHTNWVRAVAFSSDGVRLASGGDDQTVRLWDVSTGECLHTFTEHAGDVWSVAFSPDGTLLASSGADRTIRLWNIQTGACFSTLRGHTDWVISIAFSPDGTLLASSGADRTIRLWDMQTGACFSTLQEHTDFVRSVAFHPDGGTLASGSYDQTIKLWNVHTRQCIKTLHSQAGKVRSLAFSADGTILATCGLDETIKLWDTRGGSCLRILRGERPYERMNISNVTGLTAVQTDALKVLGACETGITD